MSTDNLRLLIDAYSDNLPNIDASITSIQTQIDDFTQQKTTIEDDVMTPATSDQDALLSAKAITLSAEIIYKGSNYGIINLSDWYLLDEKGINLNFIDVDTFEVDGDFSLDYINGVVVGVDCDTDGIKIRTVDSSIFGGVTTEVTLTTDATQELTSNAFQGGILVYEYEGTGWDSDPDIIQLVDIFDDAYNHLNQAKGSSGTYGIIPTITSLTLAKTIQQNNKAKYQSVISSYEKYASKHIRSSAQITINALINN